MDRLTKKFIGGYGLIKVKDNEQEIESPYKNTLDACFESWQQLGRYEDTGLMPEEIATLKAELKGQEYLAYKLIKDQIKGCLDRERKLQAEREEV